jgi:hypothetical protein
LQSKKNHTGNFETLSQNRLGTSFSYSGEKKVTVNGEFSFYENKFEGNEFFIGRISDVGRTSIGTKFGLEVTVAEKHNTIFGCKSQLPRKKK